MVNVVRVRIAYDMGARRITVKGLDRWGKRSRPPTASPYWDSAIIAAARALGCREFYSGHLGHGQEIDGVVIVSPFR